MADERGTSASVFEVGAVGDHHGRADAGGEEGLRQRIKQHGEGEVFRPHAREERHRLAERALGDGEAEQDQQHER